MAICMVFSPPKDFYTDETYEKVIAHMGEGFPPSSMSRHLKGKTESGELRIVDVFESAEDFQRFAESHAPVYKELGVDLEEVMKYATIFEIEKSIQK